jgi:hypothetical protein
MKRSSKSVSCPSSPPFPASMFRDRALSCPRVRARIVASPAVMQTIRQITPICAENFAIGSKARDESDATRATATPEAVISVLVTSTYIARLDSVVQFQFFFLASRQKLQMKMLGQGDGGKHQKIEETSHGTAL